MKRPRTERDTLATKKDTEHIVHVSALYLELCAKKIC